MPKSSKSVALVTGGSRGIGFACAVVLAKQGFDVVIAARHAEGLKQAVLQASEQGVTLRSETLDVSDLQSVESCFQDLCAEGASLDVLVHAAGMGAFSHYSSENDPTIWQQVMRTNLDGAYYCARSALQCMAASSAQPRRLIFISSVLGLRGMGNSHAYCAAKHGVNGMVKALALDVAKEQITVNSICPGWVDTAMAQADFAAMANHYQIPQDMLMQEEIQAVPIQRWIQTEEVAAMVGYLCSDTAGAVTGQCLEISGGL